MPHSNCETWSQICDELGSNIQYSAAPVLTLNDQITASDYVDILGNQVHPLVLVLLPNSDAVIQDDLPIHTARSVFFLSLRSIKMHYNIFSGQHTCPP
jgi:hypothetical protein